MMAPLQLSSSSDSEDSPLFFHVSVVRDCSTSTAGSMTDRLTNNRNCNGSNKGSSVLHFPYIGVCVRSFLLQVDEGLTRTLYAAFLDLLPYVEYSSRPAVTHTVFIPT